MDELGLKALLLGHDNIDRALTEVRRRQAIGGIDDATAEYVVMTLGWIRRFPKAAGDPNATQRGFELTIELLMDSVLGDEAQRVARDFAQSFVDATADVAVSVRAPAGMAERN